MGQTLADIAEKWMLENGIEIPARKSAEWYIQYEKWIAYTFADFQDVE